MPIRKIIKKGIKKAKGTIKSSEDKIIKRKMYDERKAKASKAVFKGNKIPSLKEFPKNTIKRIHNFIVKRTGKDSFKVMKGLTNKELPTESLMLRPKAAGGVIKKGIKAISKKKKGRPKSKEGPTKKVFVNKPITPTNQQSLLKQYKTVKDGFDKQQGIMKSIRERGDKPITEGQRKSTESFIRTMIFGSPAKGPTIVRITKDSIRRAYKKGNERLKELGKEIDKGQSIRSKMQKKSKVPAGTDTLYYKKGTGKSTIKKPRGFGAARYNKRRR
jgi:hypothetical protein